MNFLVPICNYVSLCFMDSLIGHLNQGEELAPREIATDADFLLDESGDVAKKAHFLKAMAEKGESAA